MLPSLLAMTIAMPVNVSSYNETHSEVAKFMSFSPIKSNNNVPSQIERNLMFEAAVHYARLSMQYTEKAEEHFAKVTDTSVKAIVKDVMYSISANVYPAPKDLRSVLIRATIATITSRIGTTVDSISDGLECLQKALEYQVKSEMLEECLWHNRKMEGDWKKDIGLQVKYVSDYQEQYGDNLDCETKRAIFRMITQTHIEMFDLLDKFEVQVHLKIHGSEFHQLMDLIYKAKNVKIASIERLRYLYECYSVLMKSPDKDKPLYNLLVDIISSQEIIIELKGCLDNDLYPQEIDIDEYLCRPVYKIPNESA